MASSTVFKFSLQMNRPRLTMRCKLGAKDCRSSLTPHVRYFPVVVALLLLFLPRSSAASYGENYDQVQLDALQSIFKAWNGTRDQENNLAGWNSSQTTPCSQSYTIQYPNYRGVQCLTMVNCQLIDTTTCNECFDCLAFIIGLTLNNASIVGELPAAIGDIETLATLELTGNPELTGRLPSNIMNARLYILDLHDNDFFGDLPDLNRLLWPVKLDLSGNRFSGFFPANRISQMTSLQTLNLGSNQFEGEIPHNACEVFTQLDHLDLSNNSFTGSVPNLTTIKNLQVLDLSSNKFNGSFPDLTTISSLRSVNLSRNEFTGSFLLSSIFSSSPTSSLSILDLSYNLLRGSLAGPWDVLQLRSLTELYLDGIVIDGTLDIGQLSVDGFLQMKSDNTSGSLKTLSLMNNSITDVRNAGISFMNISTIIRLQGNPYCSNPGDYTDEQRCFCQQVCVISLTSVAKANRKVVIVSSVTSGLAAFLLLAIGFGTILYRNKRYKRYLLLQVQQKFEEFDVKPTIFTYNELRTATRDFHPDMKLGQGSYGTVFKGVLANGSIVAVKQLNVQNTQKSDDFLNEIVLITGMRHRNLVNLKGCCLRDRQKILVYEYVDNYDIDQILLGSNRMLVDWPTRLKICLGVAHGLHYLHALAQPRVIHRDIKASNVLLDTNFEAKIADFGLALLFPDNQSHIMTVHVAGTKGYLAPEYALFGQLSDKVDVFSFGVLCLEVVSGRRNINEKFPIDEMYLSKWAWKLYGAGSLMQLVDPTLVLQDDQKLEVARLINIALLCLQHNEENRPTMARVVAMLQGDIESEVVVVNDEVEDQYKDNKSLLQEFERIGLDSINKEFESSVSGTSSGWELSSSEQNSLLISSMIELGHVRHR